MSIPSHTWHKMQPLDVSCFKSFKQYLQEDKASMTLKNPNWANGIILRITLVGKAANALKKTLQSTTIIAGFKATCIFSILFSSSLLILFSSHSICVKKIIILLYIKYMTNMWLKLGLLDNMYLSNKFEGHGEFLWTKYPSFNKFNFAWSCERWRKNLQIKHFRN